MTIHILHSFLIWVVLNAIVAALLLFRRAKIYASLNWRKKRTLAQGIAFYFIITMIAFNIGYAGFRFVMFILSLLGVHFAL